MGVDLVVGVYVDVCVDTHVDVHVEGVGGVCPCGVDVGVLVDVIVDVSVRSCDRGVVDVGVVFAFDIVVWCRR